MMPAALFSKVLYISWACSYHLRKCTNVKFDCFLEFVQSLSTNKQTKKQIYAKFNQTITISKISF